MQALLESLLDLLFPAHCLGCGGQVQQHRPPLLCAGCREKLLPLKPPQCRLCGLPLALKQPCPTCRYRHFAFARNTSFFLYAAPLNSLILRFKFGKTLESLSTFAALIQPSLAALQEPDLILPVPLHIRRLRQRGFNQAQLLAQTCLPHWRHKIQPNLLQRHRFTPPQMHLDGKERLSNLKGAFSLASSKAVVGKHILLVDDVFTTGSTLHECAKVLQAAGAKRVEAMTLARTGFDDLGKHRGLPLQ